MKNNILTLTNKIVHQFKTDEITLNQMWAKINDLIAIQAPKDQDDKLNDALNTLIEFAENNLPEFYTIELRITGLRTTKGKPSMDCSITIENPDGDIIEDACIETCTWREYIESAIEDDIATSIS